MDIRQEFVALLFNVRNRIRFAMDDEFKPLGITDATWRTLFFLDQTGDGVRQKELANVMGIEGPSLVRLLDSLESKGLIERKPDHRDRRGKSVFLTAEARPLLKKLRKRSALVRERLLREVSDEEIASCLSVFRCIMTGARNDGDTR